MNRVFKFASQYKGSSVIDIIPKLSYSRNATGPFILGAEGGAGVYTAIAGYHVSGKTASNNVFGATLPYEVYSKDVIAGIGASIPVAPNWGSGVIANFSFKNTSTSAYVVSYKIFLNGVQQGGVGTINLAGSGDVNNYRGAVNVALKRIPVANDTIQIKAWTTSASAVRLNFCGIYTCLAFMSVGGLGKEISVVGDFNLPPTGADTLSDSLLVGDSYSMGIPMKDGNTSLFKPVITNQIVETIAYTKKSVDSRYYIDGTKPHLVASFYDGTDGVLVENTPLYGNYFTSLKVPIDVKAIIRGV